MASTVAAPPAGGNRNVERVEATHCASPRAQYALSPAESGGESASPGRFTLELFGTNAVDTAVNANSDTIANHQRADLERLLDIATRLELRNPVLKIT